MKRRLVFISSIASPHQVKYCYALQRHFDAEFWFYEEASRTRASWWNVPLGDKCRILPRVYLKRIGRYFAPGLGRELDRFNPDIVMLGAFSFPSNVLAYRWARRHGKKTIVFTERSRDRNGVLRKYSLAWKLLRWLYRDVDMVMLSAADAVPQFRDEFHFGDKVVEGRYATDIDSYFAHPLRSAKRAYTYLFPNRMTDIYDPLLALRIFRAVLDRHPGSTLLMNAAGELGAACRAKVAELGMAGNVEFLDSIRSWEDLNKEYARSDIMILPARFSNGNFTIIEAMASGMGIVISNKVLGIGRMIEDGRNGFNCDPTVEAFMERIERYIAEPELLQRHARLNRESVRPLGLAGTAEFFAGLVASRLKLD